MKSEERHFWLHGLWLTEVHTREVKEVLGRGERSGGNKLGEAWLRLGHFPAGGDLLTCWFIFQLDKWSRSAVVLRSAWWGWMEWMFWGTCCTVLRLPVLDVMSNLFWTYTSWGSHVRIEQSSSALKAVVQIKQVSCPDALSGTSWRDRGGGRKFICSEPLATHRCTYSLQ